LLDVIARAGGPRNPGYDTWVMLERERAPSNRAVRSPRQSTGEQYLHSASGYDLLFTEPRTFTAFGGFRLTGHFPIAAWRLMLAEAMVRLAA